MRKAFIVIVDVHRQHFSDAMAASQSVTSKVHSRTSRESRCDRESGTRTPSNLCTTPHQPTIHHKAHGASSGVNHA